MQLLRSAAYCSQTRPGVHARSALVPRPVSSRAHQRLQFGRPEVLTSVIARQPELGPNLQSAPASENPGIAAESEAQKPITWTSNWYPVQPLDSLDTKAPTQVHILGKKLVVWTDSKAGTWHCADDRCPHRLAPLSEGRISESGNLQCSYHGWEFNGAGACARIPQLDDPKAHATACASGRACVAVYPVRVQYGMLWVWPEAGAQGAAAAEEAQLPMHTDDEYLTEWYVRDLPMRCDMLMENLLDQSHVPFSHHGVIGNRNALMSFTISTTPVTRTGFTVDLKFKGTNNGYTLDLILPHSLKWVWPFAGGTSFTFAVPTKPGWCKVLMLSHAGFRAKALGIPTFAQPWLSRIPGLWSLTAAVEHAVKRHEVLDGDSYFVHVAEHAMPSSAGLGAGVSRSYFMPANADLAVQALRQWYDRFAAKTVPTSYFDPDNMPPELSRKQVFDRWEQHTKNCPHCKKALTLLDAVSVGAVVLGAAAVIGTVFLAVQGLATAGASASASGQNMLGMVAAALPVLLGAGVVAACISTYKWLQTQRTKFFYQDYIHAHR